MNKFVVLSKQTQTFFIQRLMEEVGKDLVKLINPWVDPIEDFAGKVLVRTTGVHENSKDLDYIDRAFNPYQVINPLSALKPLRNKRDQYEVFQIQGLPIFPWLNLLEADEESLERFMGLQEEEHFLIKPHRGQGGWGIKIFDVEGLRQWFRQSADKEFILQPYKGDFPEVRAFFIQGGEVITLIRERADMVAANFNQGGHARVTENIPELNFMIQRWCEYSQQIYGAVDAILTPQGPVVLEFNAVPGIEQLEAVSRQNIVRKILGLLE